MAALDLMRAGGGASRRSRRDPLELVAGLAAAPHKHGSERKARRARERGLADPTVLTMILLWTMILEPLLNQTGALMRRRAAGQGAAADNAAVLPPQAAYTCLRGGAPGGAAVRWQGFASLQITARARLGMGFANPSLQGARGVRRNAPAPQGAP